MLQLEVQKDRGSLLNGWVYAHCSCLAALVY